MSIWSPTLMRAAGTYAVVNTHSTSYNVSPFIIGFGGYILDAEGNPGLNDPKTIEAVEYNKKFADLQADGDYNTVTTLFNEGKAQAIIGRPVARAGNTCSRNKPRRCVSL